MDDVLNVDVLGEGSEETKEASTLKIDEKVVGVDPSKEELRS